MPLSRTCSRQLTTKQYCNPSQKQLWSKLSFKRRALGSSDGNRAGVQALWVNWRKEFLRKLAHCNSPLQLLLWVMEVRDCATSLCAKRTDTPTSKVDVSFLVSYFQSALLLSLCLPRPLLSGTSFFSANPLLFLLLWLTSTKAKCVLLLSLHPVLDRQVFFLSGPAMEFLSNKGLLFLFYSNKPCADFIP